MSLNQCNEKIGNVTDDEKKEVEFLYERILGLKELLPVLDAGEKTGDNDKNLYDRAVQDLGATTRKQQEWWNRMGKKYKWKGSEKTGASWLIDFEDNTIYLQSTSI
jgi:CXXX repeat modification system protein